MVIFNISCRSWCVHYDCTHTPFILMNIINIIIFWVVSTTLWQRREPCLHFNNVSHDLISFIAFVTGILPCFTLNFLLTTSLHNILSSHSCSLSSILLFTVFYTFTFRIVNIYISCASRIGISRKQFPDEILNFLRENV